MDACQNPSGSTAASCGIAWSLTPHLLRYRMVKETATMNGPRRPSEDGVMNVRYPYTRSYRDRHGKLRIEYRRYGKMIALPPTPGTAEFQAAYDAAAAAVQETTAAPTVLG